MSFDLTIRALKLTILAIALANHHSNGTDFKNRYQSSVLYRLCHKININRIDIQIIKFCDGSIMIEEFEKKKDVTRKLCPKQVSYTSHNEQK